MLRIAHVINPFPVGQDSDLSGVPPLVYDAMRSARRLAEYRVQADLCAAVYPEDAACVPEQFTRLPDLQRSIRDVRPFPSARRLPLLYDIIDRVCSATEADYIVYTNLDIILMPQFYVAIESYISAGYTSLIINRREVEPTLANPCSTLSQIWSALGEPGAGYDCFVFKRADYQNFVRDMSCIGVAAVDTGLAANLMARTEKFLFLPEEHLTCHIGNDRTWMQQQFDPLTRHNYREFSKVWTVLGKELHQRYDMSHPIMDRIERVSSEQFPQYILSHRAVQQQ